ncbi:MAG TPA: hypothetical protein VLU95_06685 [Candidatus Acidoferrum sp.]|nr:hypothetical protein [Candidatus Acidoferrum sp.]
MSTIFGYGEDALTLWFLKNQLAELFNKFNDNTMLSDCIIFYRPSFGRSGGAESAEFGEFDAILASKENVYLIESKWDNHRQSNRSELLLRPEQTERHRVFKCYLSNQNNEKEFIEGKKIAPANSLLSMNLQFVLSQIRQYCPNSAKPDNVKNVLLYFHGPKSRPPRTVSDGFTIVPIEYEGNYVNL